MMLPTHVLVGLVLALPLAWLAPDLAPAVYAGAVVGSVLPDLDMYAGHRRTLHYPVYYSAAAVAAAAVAVLLPTALTVGLAVGLTAAAIHCRMDRYGGSLELRPWERTSEKAVYDHYRGEWRAPLRWAHYDGSPRDLGIALVLGTPLLLVHEGPIRWLVLALLTIATVYAALRKRLANVAEALGDRFPEAVVAYVPGRYRDD